MAYRNKTYLCFDGDNDIHYFYLMKAWKYNQTDFFREFSFYDAHEINYARDTSIEATIKRKLRERLLNSKLFVVLVGEQTKFLYKFVRWEIEQAISQAIPIVVVNLNGKRYMDESKCPPLLQKELALHISFNQKILEKALREWVSLDGIHRRNGETGPFYYIESTYKQYGL